MNKKDWTTLSSLCVVNRAKSPPVKRPFTLCEKLVLQVKEINKSVEDTNSNSYYANDENALK
jgi:hypothetical protein